MRIKELISSNILLGIIFAIILGTLGYIFLNSYPRVILSTDKSEYLEGEMPKIIIKNKLTSIICFSSCYPYFLEKREKGEWEKYNYGKCGRDNLTDYCVNKGESKTFEIIAPYAETGIHRINIGISEGKKEGESFTEDRNYFSNDFRIKNF